MTAPRNTSSSTSVALGVADLLATLVHAWAEATLARQA